MKIITWFAGFFEDQNGKSSRKAATLYDCLFFLGYIIIEDKTPDIYVLAAIVIVILFCLGAITREGVENIVSNLPTKKDTK